MILELQSFDGFLSAVKEEENISTVRNIVSYSKADEYHVSANIAYTTRVDNDIIRFIESVSSETIVSEDDGKAFTESIEKKVSDYNESLAKESIAVKNGMWASA